MQKMVELLQLLVLGGNDVYCEDECGDCTICLGLYDDDYFEDEE